MILSYGLRLVCLCLVSFFAVNTVVGFAISFASGKAIRIAETMPPRSAARFLFLIRMLPFTLGLGVVLGLCVPSYLWLEPQAASERIGLVCLILALLGAASCAGSIARAARAIATSVRCKRDWQQAGCETLLPGEPSKVVIIQKDAPLLALVGVFRSRLVVSQTVLRSLSAEQLDLALQHEHAHRISRDNLKRLFLLLSRRPIPLLRGFSALEQNWARFSEWAADDEAVRGDSYRALSLAAALLRLARLGALPHLTFLHTALLSADQDLAARVDRLLRVQPLQAVTPPRTRTLGSSSTVMIAVCLGVLLVLPATLSAVHRLLELFLR
jgi:Zn-dependent protease with chaperone function